MNFEKWVLQQKHKFCNFSRDYIYIWIIKVPQNKLSVEILVSFYLLQLILNEG